jgi:hypothetical protein
MLFKAKRYIHLKTLHKQLPTRRWAGPIMIGLCAVILLSTLQGVVAARAQSTGAADASMLDADFAVEWMQQYYDVVQQQAISAPEASRIYAYGGVTLWEAVQPGLPGTVSLSTQIKNMPAMPAPDASQVWDYPSIANSALAAVIKGLIPNDKAAAAADTLRAKQAADRKKAAPDSVDRSLTQGDALGAALLAWIAKDGFAEQKGKAFTVDSSQPFKWVPTSPGTKPVGAYWGTIRPLALENADICGVARDIEFSTDKNSAFYKQALEVTDIRRDLTKEEKTTADFWVDTPGLTGAPAGHWVSIANQLVPQLGLKLGKAAQMYALVGIALGDAFISCWEMKYKDSLLRPVTYIKRYINPNWEPYIQTPPFPTYPSGHSVASSAAADVLTALFGTTVFVDATHAKRLNIQPRTYYSFEQAADEAAISRLYGGIHFRFDIENGLKQGRCVAAHVINNIKLSK